MIASDSATVLRACGGYLAKRIGADGAVAGRATARTFDLFPVALADLDALARLLARLGSRPDCCIVRGEPIGPTRAVLRRLHADPETGEPATLRDVPRRWLALDMENIPLPEGVAPADLGRCGEAARACLPPAFLEARCLVAASGSHGFRPDMRLRLWFWSARPLSGAELKRWLAGTPADPSVFGAVQPIYTASPVFAKGARDPLGSRLTALPGAPLLHPPSPAALAPPARKPAALPAPARHADRYVEAVLVSAAHRIATAEKRHPAILAEALGLARFVRAGRLAEGLFRSVLRRAGEAAGKDDAAELDAIAAWALAHAREAARA